MPEIMSHYMSWEDNYAKQADGVMSNPRGLPIKDDWGGGGGRENLKGEKFC